MKLPSKIRVVSGTYKVDLVNGDTIYQGQCDHDKRVIHVSDKLSSGQRAATLLHELIHAILAEYRMKIKEETEEQLVWVIEHGLCAFAKDHQDVFQNIIKEMKDA